jgi:hypothetical protein
MVTDWSGDGSRRLGSAGAVLAVFVVFGTAAFGSALSGVSATGSVGTVTPSGGSAPGSGTNLFAFERQPHVVTEWIVFGSAGAGGGGGSTGGYSRGRVINEC